MKEIQDFLNQYPVVSQVLKLVICALLALVVSAVLLRLMRKFFQRISSRKKMNQTNTRLIENAFRFLKCRQQQNQTGWQTTLCSFHPLRSFTPLQALQSLRKHIM